MTREIDFRFVVVRGGADYTELHPARNSSPSIRADSSGDIKTSFAGDFVDPGEAVNWVSDEIRPELIIDGVTHRLGVFLPATVTMRENETQKTVHIEAYDRCWLLSDTLTENLYYIAAGTNYITAVENLLTAAGVSLVSKTATDCTIQEAREDWELGTSYLTIVNQLLSEINYNPLWFDKDGMAILEPASTPTAASIEHTLDSQNVLSLMRAGLSRQTDIYSAPNVFVCTCANPDKSGNMIAKSENTNPQSPLSIARRGRRIVKLVQVDNIASQAELQAYADRLRNESMITGETIQVTTSLLPGFGVNDVTALQYEDLFCVCIERAWSLNLSTGGTMSHTLEKVVINLG